MSCVLDPHRLVTLFAWAVTDEHYVDVPLGARALAAARVIRGHMSAIEDRSRVPELQNSGLGVSENLVSGAHAAVLNAVVGMLETFVTRSERGAACLGVRAAHSLTVRRAELRRMVVLFAYLIDFDLLSLQALITRGVALHRFVSDVSPPSTSVVQPSAPFDASRVEGMLVSPTVYTLVSPQAGSGSGAGGMSTAAAGDGATKGIAADALRVYRTTVWTVRRAVACVCVADVARAVVPCRPCACRCPRRGPRCSR